jgi:hypothetical protein
VSEKTTNVKIDLALRNETPSEKLAAKVLQQARTRRGKILAQKKAKSIPVDESVAVRINLDYINKRITQKSFLNKTWSKRSVNVSNPNKQFRFETTNADVVKLYVDVQSSEFIFGFVPREDVFVELAKYGHSNHNMELFKLNSLRLSGCGLKLKALDIKSKDRVELDTQTSSSELSEQEAKQRSYTLKQLVRQLHVCKPVENVMCLLGKKYPANFEEFIKSKLPGLFVSERAGKRMKLVTPETWETQVSMKGNKASVWEQLIDNKKLPYMAMLRNLRNMIKCGISERHHVWVIKKLQDEGAVVHSRQFPFRFFTAYEVLDELLDELNDYLKWCSSPEALALESSVFNFILELEIPFL